MSGDGAQAARSRAGLTLLEMLVAMSLLAMIGTAALGGLRFGAAAWERTAEIGAHAAEARAAQRFLTRLIASARDVRALDGSRDPAVVFDGRADRLAFVAPLPAPGAVPALQILVLERRDDGALTLSWAPLDSRRPSLASRRAGAEPLGAADAALSLPEASAATLVDGVSAIEFRYFGAPRSTGAEAAAPAWRETWVGRTRLPELVEIRLRLDHASGAPSADGATRRRPDLEMWPPLSIRLNGEPRA